MRTVLATALDFEKDAAWRDDARPAAPDAGALIDGVTVTPLVPRADGRGRLVELLTLRDGPQDAVVHAYQVFAAPGSIRAWFYHERQDDRLSLTNGTFRLALFDIRDGSPTQGRCNVFDVGAAAPCQIRIPKFVAHGLANMGETEASFVNMPTCWYDPADPDKKRLPYPDARIPYRFE